jgi:hypothetical protein
MIKPGNTKKLTSRLIAEAKKQHGSEIQIRICMV